jgi:hypothetical protein
LQSGGTRFALRVSGKNQAESAGVIGIAGENPRPYVKICSAKTRDLAGTGASQHGWARVTHLVTRVTLVSAAPAHFAASETKLAIPV